MATYTPNIDLKKPAQSDKIRIADLNGNADNIDAALGADFGVSNKPSVDDAVNSLGAGLAIISNGDIHAAITAGQYVYVRGHGTLTEGLYVATANVSQNGALTGNNVDAVSGGGLNALNSNIASLKLIKISKTITIPDGTQTEQAVDVNISDSIPSGKTIHSITNARLSQYVLPYSNTNGTQRTWIEQINTSTNVIRIKSTSSAWTNYDLILIVFVQ